ncbi:MAG: GNAT family N-acetyltransferase [Elusimicrobiota bacterium]
MADFSIEIADNNIKKDWDRFVLEHPLGTFFHLFDWLEIVQWKTGFAFKPLVLRSGGTVCGIIPIFIQKRYSVNLCMSPPPRVATPWMGPLLKHQSDKQYKIEKYNLKAMEAMHKFLVEELKSNYIRIVCVSGLEDIRSFKWIGYRCEPGYTYFLNITDKDKVFERFDGRIRTGIRKAQQSELFYKHADNSMIPLIIDAVLGRYKEQGLSFALNQELMGQLRNSHAGSFIETTGVFDDEGFVTGNILIRFKNNVHHWIGGVQPYRNHQGANEFLHWSGIDRYSDEGIRHYEFMGANTRHLCEHKSKYNPELRVFYSCEWYNTRGKLVNWAKSFINKKRTF